MRHSFAILLALAALCAGALASPHTVFAENDVVPGEVIVRYRTDMLPLVRIAAETGGTLGIASLDAIDDAVGVTDREQVFTQEPDNPELGTTVRLRFDPTTTIDDALQAYSDHPLIDLVEPDPIARIAYTPDDSFFHLQWNFQRINIPAAWDADTQTPKYGGDPDGIVAVVDTGIAYEDRGSYAQADDLANTTFVAGYDFVNDDSHPNDDHGHGTHMTGTIAQSTNNTTGTAGIAFNTSIMPIKVLNAQGIGSMSTIAEGIDYARTHGADVISMSLGGSSGSSTLETAIVRAADDGIVIVAAAGNGGDDGIGDDSLDYPARYSDVIAVGAVRYDKARAPYSNYGAGIDVVAPGGDLNRDQNGDGYADGILQEYFEHASINYTDFTYAFLQGTSSATAHVSGVAALLRAAGAAGKNVQEILESTAEDLGDDGYDTEFGYGLIDADAAMQRLVSDTVSPTTSSSVDPDPSGSGWILQQAEVTLHAEDNEGGSGVSTTYYTWDDESRSVYTGSFDVPEGEHTLTYWSSDSTGNIESQRNRTFKLDTADPVFQVLNPSASVTTDSTVVAFSGKIIDAASGVASLTIDGRTVSLDSAGQFNTPVTIHTGTQEIVLTATDSAGHGYTTKRTLSKTLGQRIVTGAGQGGGPHVRVMEADGHVVSEFYAYDRGFIGGVNTSIGDVDGDGDVEVITAPASGAAPLIRVFTTNGHLESEFYAYAIGFTGGVNIAVGNVEGKGAAEIITAPALGGGPNIRIFGYRNGSYVPTTENFLAYDESFRGGVNIAAVDLEGNGTAEIVTAPQSDGGPQLRIFGFRSGVYVPVILGLMAYDPGFRGGVTLGGGDIDGDGADEIITGVASDGGPQVRIFERVFDGTVHLKNTGFIAFHPDFRGGINVGTVDQDRDGTDEILVSVRSDSDPLVRVFNGSGTILYHEWMTYTQSFTGGVRLSTEP